MESDQAQLEREAVKKVAAEQFTPFLNFIQLTYVIVIGLSIGYFVNVGGSLAETKATSFLLLNDGQRYSALHHITKFLGNPMTVYLLFLPFFAIDWLVGQTRWEVKIRKHWKNLRENFASVMCLFFVQLICVFSLGLSITFAIFKHPPRAQYSPYLWFGIYGLFTFIWSRLMLQGVSKEEQRRMAEEFQKVVIQRGLDKIENVRKDGALSGAKKFSKIARISILAWLRVLVSHRVLWLNTFVLTPFASIFCIFVATGLIVTSPITFYIFFGFFVSQLALGVLQAYTGFVALEKIVQAG